MDDLKGWDFQDADNDTRPASGGVAFHGTEVAGVAVAIANSDGLGLVGVAPGSRVLTNGFRYSLPTVRI